MRVEGRRSRARRPNTEVPSVEPTGLTPAPRTPPRVRAPTVELPGSLAAALSPKVRRSPDAPLFLGPHERRRLAGFWPQLPPATRAELSLALEGQGPLAQALVLRSLHARLGALIGGAPFALGEVTRYAQEVRGLPGAELLRLGSVLDRDPLANSSRFDPLGLAERRGLIHARGEDDRQADNDGLFQRFTASCGPTVIQMMAAEADPILAKSLHEAGLLRPGLDDRVAEFQRQLLEELGGLGPGIQEATIRARISNALGKAGVAPEAAAALRRALDGARLGAEAQRALLLVRAAYDGFPSAAELKLARRPGIPKTERGIDGWALKEGLSRHVTPRTGVEYQMIGAPDGFARGQAKRHLDQVARALRDGVHVPFGISEPGHWMLLSDVQGQKPTRQWLVSDPLGGRTRWVSERELLSGAFASGDFKLTTGRQRSYIDCFFVPTRAPSSL